MSGFRIAVRRLSVRRLIASAVLLALLLPPTAPAQVNLPSLGDAVSQDLDVNSERRYGDEIMSEIWLDPDCIDDPLLQEYLVGTFEPLVAAARKLGNITEETSDHFAWRAFLVRDKTINAFALPGGFVGVHLGLIAMTGSRDELASVLGHELSHVTQRHIARRIAGDSRNSLLATAAILAGILAAAKGAPDAAQAAIVTGQAAAQAASLAFSRDMEREPDRVGFQVMSTAGYAPSGMSSMFERMEQATHLMDSGNYPYLRSHPLTNERIADSRLRVGTRDFVRPIGTPEHAMMAARARRDDGHDGGLAAAAAKARSGRAGRRTQRHRFRPDRRPLCQRARLDQAARLGARRTRHRRGRALLQGFGDRDVGGRAHRDLVFLRAELAQARVQPAAGMAALDTLSGDHSRPMLMARAGLAMEVPDRNASRTAADDLQTWTSLHTEDMLAWSTLAQLWDRLGQPLRSVRAQAEVHAAAGDLRGAIDRLRSGLRLSRSPSADQIEASVIDARLRTLTYQRRQRLAEMYPNGVPRGEEP